MCLFLEIDFHERPIRMVAYNRYYEVHARGRVVNNSRHFNGVPSGP